MYTPTNYLICVVIKILRSLYILQKTRIITAMFYKAVTGTLLRLYCDDTANECNINIVTTAVTNINCHRSECQHKNIIIVLMAQKIQIARCLLLYNNEHLA